SGGIWARDRMRAGSWRSSRSTGDGVAVCWASCCWSLINSFLSTAVAMSFQDLHLSLDLIQLAGQVQCFNTPDLVVKNHHGPSNLIPGHPGGQGTLESRDGAAADVQQASDSAFQSVLAGGGIGGRKRWLAQPGLQGRIAHLGFGGRCLDGRLGEKGG